MVISLYNSCLSNNHITIKIWIDMYVHEIIFIDLFSINTEFDWHDFDFQITTLSEHVKFYYRILKKYLNQEFCS